MESFWARTLDPSGRPGLNYWEYFADRLSQLANLPVQGWLMDLGTYDGNVLFKAMARAGSSRLVGIGADVYPGGFQDGIQEAASKGWAESSAFTHTDANALGFETASFDLVLSNFLGWDVCFDFDRFAFTGPNRMTREVYRVLRPGGQVGIGAWVQQRDIDWMISKFHQLLPGQFEDTICYARENPEGQRIILEDVGFEEVKVHVETTDIFSSDPDTWWQQMQQATGVYFQQVTDPDTLAFFKREVLKDLGEHLTKDGVRFSKTVTFAFGRKPC